MLFQNSIQERDLIHAASSLHPRSLLLYSLRLVVNIVNIPGYFGTFYSLGPQHAMLLYALKKYDVFRHVRIKSVMSGLVVGKTLTQDSRQVGIWFEFG